MNFVLWRRAVRESVWLWAGIGLLLFSFGWMRVWFTSRIDTSRVANLIENAPQFVLDFFPVDPKDMLTYPARVGLSFEEPLVYALVAIWAIARGSDAVSGKISAGTMELLLAQPVSRMQHLLSQIGVAVAGLALLVLCLWSGLGAGIRTNSVLVAPEPIEIKAPILGITLFTLPVEGEGEMHPMSEFVGMKTYVASSLNLFAFGLMLAGLTTLISAFDRYRWRTIGIIATFLILQVTIELLSKSSSEAQWLGSFTVFSLYEPIQMAVRTAKGTGAWALWLPAEMGEGWVMGPLSYSLIMLSLGVGGFIGSAFVFSRRDLPAPL